MNRYSENDRYSQQDQSSSATWMLGGALLGAVAMYFADPERGQDRRTMASDKLRDAADRSRTMLDSTSQDLGGRMQGVREQANTLLSKTTETFSTQLESGKRIREMAMQEEWPQDLRTWATVGGAAISAVGMLRRSPVGSIAALAGLLLVARSLSNTPLTNMASSFRPAAARPVRTSKTIHIEASPEAVFDYFANYENFPRFMSNVKEVTDLGEGRSHWTVTGPAGIPLQWNSKLTDSNRPNTLAWHSEDGAMVDNGGTIRIQGEGGGSRVTVEIVYQPPGGELGHKVASMFGKDPKQQMDEDLANMKRFIESGQTPPDAAAKADDKPAGGVLH